MYICVCVCVCVCVKAPRKPSGDIGDIGGVSDPGLKVSIS